MIREHEFNSRWWGAPVGIVSDPELFRLPKDERRRALARFAWAEYRVCSDSVPDRTAIHDAGFFHVDTQVGYRIGLARVPSTSSLEGLRVEFADVRQIVIRGDEMAPFRAERFRHLPGIDDGRINERYALWGNRLIEENPEVCLEVFDGERRQGWFLGRQSDGRLNLTLAMLDRTACISGLHLYQRAMIAYASRGWRTGWATFSVENLPVLNIFSSLGARFTQAEHFWLWINTMPKAQE